MDLSFSKDDVAFRDEVRRFIDENFDSGMRAKIAQSKNGYLDKDGQLKWQRALYKRGWAAPNWPIEYGGPGWTPSQKYIFESETAAAGTPIVSPMGLKMVAPVLMAFGS
jgi:alkylation response protein AidB-like acyl-CoA dehydrogenase